MGGIMKRIRIFRFITVFAVIAFSSCVTPDTDRSSQQDIDSMIRAAALRTLELLPAGEVRTLAVYYFTSEEGIHESSDYVIQGLTTELANAGEGRVKIVSRQAVDRLVEEYKYQLSELVDKDRQVDIGKQLGADLILTGFITRGKAGYNINIQLLETETGLVLGGYRDAYAAPAASHPARGTSASVSGKRQYPELIGGSTTTVIYEDYADGLSTLKMSRFEESYGERVLKSDGGISVGTDGSGNDFAAYAFTAEFDHVDFLDGWEDSDAYFYFSVEPETEIGDFDGISLSLMPAGFSQVTLILKQAVSGDFEMFSVPLILEEGVWNDIKLPFGVFRPDNHRIGLDPAKPVRIELSVGFWENLQHGYFEGTEIAGEVSVDNVGYFTFNEPDPPELIEGFDDEVTRMPFYGELYGARFFVDYRETDAGILTENKSISGNGIIYRREEDGPRDGYLDVTAYLRKGGEEPEDFGLSPVSLYVRSTGMVDFTGFSSISFLAKSSILDYGTFEIHDDENDEYYSVDFSLTSNWGRYRFDFKDLLDEGRTLAERKNVSSRINIYFWFDVSEAALDRAAQAGELIVDFALDEIMLSND